MSLVSQRFAICTPVAPLMANPEVASPQISQLLAGRVVESLEAQGDWFRVRGPDEYEGWIHRGYVGQVPNDDARRSIQVARLSLGCVTSNASGHRRAMPLGALLTAEERVKSGEAIDAAMQSELFPPEAGA